MRALLVEDDEMIGRGLVEALGDVGITVDWVKTGTDAYVAKLDQSYAVVLLDLMLPGRDGMEILHNARQNGSQIPIIIVSARDTLEDRLAGLDQGADDYLVKPFDTRELISRIYVLLRRKAGQPSSVLKCGEIDINLNTHVASYAGQSYRLPPREFALLHTLIENPGMVWSKHRLEDRLYGWNQEVESNAVEVLIHYLRKKLGHGVIKNVRGVGWKVEKPE